MIRTILYMVGAVLVISLIRAVMGIVAKGFSEVVKPSRPHGQSAAPVAGELKKDPICGTYVAAGASLKKAVSGTTYHFCSAACRDKFSG